MNGGPVYLVQIILIVVFGVVVLGIAIPACVSFWRSYRQVRRDRRQRKLQLRGPR